MRAFPCNDNGANDLPHLWCTTFGHSLVDGLHSIENTSTYKTRFSIDSKIGKRTTGIMKLRPANNSWFEKVITNLLGWAAVITLTLALLMNVVRELKDFIAVVR